MMDTLNKIFVEMMLPFAPRLFGGALLFAGLWLAGNLAAAFVRKLGKSRHLNEDLLNVLAKSVSTACIILGAVCGLGTLGVDVTALVASLGLTGFALGFALKDVISNALSGVLLLLYEPFEVGDHVKVSSFAGVVVKTSLRYTELAADDQIIFIPNSMLFNNAVIVETAKQA